MAEESLAGVDGRIFTREWRPAGDLRRAVVVSDRLNAHEWAIPALLTPQAANIRKAFYGLIAITSLGLASAMPTTAANPSGVSVSPDDLVQWLADGERGLWIHAHSHEWFYARFASGCHEIGKTNSIVLETDGSGHMDGRSSVTMPTGTQCRPHSLAPSVWMHVTTLEWFYARFVSGCHGIDKTNSIAFETGPSGHIDGRSSVTMAGGTRCRLHGLAPSGGPPKNFYDDVVEILHVDG